MAETKEERKVQVTCRLAEGVRDAMMKLCQAYGLDSSEYIRNLIIADLRKEKLLDQRVHPELANNH